MTARTPQRLVDAMPVAMSTIVGALTAVSIITGGLSPLVPVWLWIAMLVVFLCALAAVTVIVDQVPETALGVAFIVAWLVGAALVITAPAASWMPIVTVFTALASAYLFPTWGSVVVVAVNCVAIALSAAIPGAPVTAIVIGTGIYAILQASSVLSVRLFMREAGLRRDLEVTNLELRTTRELLAESTREAERTRIARDLHDVLGHQLTVLSLELEIASHRATEPARTHVVRAQEVARTMLADVRATVGDVRSGAPSLTEALTAVVQGVSSPTIRLHLEDVEVGDERAALLLRATQELLTNVIRHAEASACDVLLARVDNRIALTVADDGAGGEADSREGNALTWLRERVAEASGTVLIERNPGYRVRIEVPA